MESGITEMTELKIKILKAVNQSPKRTKNIFWSVGSHWHNVKYHLINLEKLGLVHREQIKEDKKTFSVWNITLNGKKILEKY